MNIVFEKIQDLIPIKTCIKTKENGDLLIVSNSKLDIIYLNETSKDFYAFCDGNRRISQIHQQMLDVYDISSEQLESDLVALVRDLQWKDLINLKGAHQ